jgi:hypothetical protein
MALDLYLEDEGKYDNAFLSVLQDVGKINPFLEHLFSFLRRRTDFYLLLDNEGKFGFAPGAAEKMVLSTFKKHELIKQKSETEKLRRQAMEAAERIGRPEEESVGRHEAITTASEDKPTSKPVQSSKTPDPKHLAATHAAETYNGSETDVYKWAQTALDIEMIFPVPKGTTAKDMKIDIKPDHLRVVLLNSRDPDKPGPVVLADKPFLYKVKAEESMWHLDKEKGAVVVNLEKCQDMMWKCVLQGEQELDVHKMDTTRDISEFDSDAQAAIQRARYDHHMKMLGKPTSQDQKTAEILKQAWDAEGSPFKGTPYDPSRVNFSGNFS